MYGYPSRPPPHLRYQQQQQHHNAHRQHLPHHPHNDTTPSTPDPRFPTPPSDPKEPTTLLSPDGEYTAHLLLLLPPQSYHALTLLTQSRACRAPTLHTVNPEDLIARAVAAQKFWHVSDGPRGGIWVVEEGGLEVVSAVVEELEGWRGGRRGKGGGKGEGEEGGTGVRMGEGGVEEDEEAGGRWEVLGVGKGGDEGRVFLVHGCGVGARVLQREEEGEGMAEKEEGEGMAEKEEGEGIAEKEEGEGIGARGGEKGKGKAVEKLKKSWVGRFWETM